MRVYVLNVRPRMKMPFIAWLIMLFQGMNPFKKESFSHIAVSFVSITGNMLAVDATSKGVRVRTLANFLSEYKIVKGIDLDIDTDYPKFLSWLEDILGLNYDKKSLLGLALKALGFKKSNKFGSNYKKLICSEVPISLIDTFMDYSLGDSDNYDLLMTMDLVESINKGQYK